MKTRFTALCQLMALTLLVCCCFSVLASAQGNDERVTPRFVVLPPKPAPLGAQEPSSTLATWNGSFTYNNHQYNYVMVGADPSTGQGTIIPTLIIPVKIVLSDGTTYDPFAGGAFSPLARTVNSPVFDRTTTYTQGGTDVGTTQYVDAYQRANFWNLPLPSSYHVLLGGPTSRVQILPEITLNVPANKGHNGHPFGFTVGEVDINYFDQQINTYMTTQPQISPSKFPIFLVDNVYLTSGGCCIGGYHSATGQQTYAVFDYDTHPGVFSQDVSALSHEVAEWMDDPLVPHQNNTPCGVMENGDPLEGGYPGHPFGTWEYPLYGFTYHLQDLVFLKYFGGDPNEPVNSWWTFQGPASGITRTCQNGS